ncbi:MAG: hypothetical protein OIN89_09015 [Candidatus Methanoperedens sp.]|jgi:hypothetical protein|nr:hypothetical protein [Candidatus Methanoperedens sp.]PKL52749.1 MAG: hypothetical protein CVV36_10830 [Candidatus Methanoperedenaceae archaeon HGW-Methanoperedenaceae-1]
MKILNRCIEENKDIKKIEKKELQNALKKNKFRDLICNKIYPELKNFKDKHPTYYRIDSDKAFRYKYKTHNGVIVFLRPDINSEMDFEKYFGCGIDNFLNDVKNNEIIPMIGWLDENEDTYKPYTKGIYKELFNKWDVQPELDKIIPLYANRLEYALSKSDWKEEYKTWFEGFEILKREKIDFKEIDLNLNKEFVRDNLPSAKATEYLSEKCGWLGLVGANGVVEDIQDYIMKYNRGGDKKYLYLAADYAFYAHQFITAPIFYSKGFASTISKADIWGAYDTFKSVSQTHNSYPHHLYLCLLNSIYSSKQKFEEIIVPKFKTPKGKTPDEETKISKHVEKSEDIQSEIEEVTKAQNKLFDNCQKPSKIDTIEEGFGAVQELIKNLADTYDKEYRSKFDIMTTGITFALENAHPLLSFADPVFKAMEVSEKIEKNIEEHRILGEFTIPVYCWKEGESDAVPNNVKELFKK